MGIFIFIFGLLIGSFLNVCIYRIPRKESIAFPPSHCTNCNTQLKPVDLIPVLSFVAYRGKCKYCKAKISLQYPIIELSNGLITFFLYQKFGLTVEMGMYAILSSILVVITMIDFFTQEIPDELNLLGLITGIIFLGIMLRFSNVVNSSLGLLIGGGLFLLIAVVSGGAMGGGDIKLMGVLGLWFGWKLILMLSIISFIIGAIASLLLMALKIKSMKDYIPFGPFISISAMIIIFFGSDLLSWYLSFI
ncbi:MAG: prepilin peptidase [Clostridia bacterium]|jgi:leader peptidase (prepilin peptidase)/N-methyltransferase|nr:prepilin peptidase [Clostridia bacterium]